MSEVVKVKTESDQNTAQNTGLQFSVGGKEFNVISRCAGNALHGDKTIADGDIVTMTIVVPVSFG